MLYMSYPVGVESTGLSRDSPAFTVLERAIRRPQSLPDRWRPALVAQARIPAGQADTTLLTYFGKKTRYPL